MYTDFYNTPTYNYNSGGIDSTWMVIALVLALVGGILAYFLFVTKKNTSKSPFVVWLHEFLNFKRYFIGAILKVCYLCSAIFITLGSFGLIRTSVGAFFGMLIFGNIIARISYELMLMFITLVENSTEINKKLKGTAKEEVKVKKEEK